MTMNMLSVKSIRSYRMSFVCENDCTVILFITIIMMLGEECKYNGIELIRIGQSNSIYCL